CPGGFVGGLQAERDGLPWMTLQETELGSTRPQSSSAHLGLRRLEVAEEPEAGRRFAQRSPVPALAKPCARAVLVRLCLSDDISPSTDEPDNASIASPTRSCRTRRRRKGNPSYAASRMSEFLNRISPSGSPATSPRRRPQMSGSRSTSSRTAVARRAVSK